MKYLFLIFAIVIGLAGCQASTPVKTNSGPPAATVSVDEVSPASAQTAVSKAYSQFIDVRTPAEYVAGHAERAVNIPLDTLAANLDRLEMNQPVYIICETGNRSKTAAGILTDAGFESVVSVTGGTTAWKAAGLPMETKAPHTAANSK